MTFGSLFSGVGGFDMGLEAAGMEVAWQVECDNQAASVLRHRWPDVDLFKDVCDVGRCTCDVRLAGERGARHVVAGSEPSVDRDGRAERGEDPVGYQSPSDLHGVGHGCPVCGQSNLARVDLICGGFPCQDLSVAGRRAGLAGERSGLFYEFMRIVDELAPRWVLIENVPGLLSSNGGRDMGAILGTLGELGYGYAYRVLDTQYFGPPQRRRRVFIVGRAGGFCPPEVLLEPEGLPWNPPPRREAREGAAEGSEGGAGGEGGLAGTLTTDLDRGGTNSIGGTVAFRASEYRTGQFTEDEAAGALTQGTDPTRNGIVLPDTTQITSKTNRSRPRPGDPCHPLAAGAHPPSVTTAIPRRLTPRECERLQGWPDDWTRYGTTPEGEVVELADSPRYRMVGNGVSAPVAEWIGHRIRAVESRTPTESEVDRVETGDIEDRGAA